METDPEITELLDQDIKLLRTTFHMFRKTPKLPISIQKGEISPTSRAMQIELKIAPFSHQNASVATDGSGVDVEQLLAPYWRSRNG